MRYCKKSYFDITYCFGCKKFNSAPFLMKIGANKAYLRGVSVAILNRLQPVFIGPVWSGFSSVFFFKKTTLQPVWFGFFGSVQSGFDLFLVHRTGPLNPRVTYKEHILNNLTSKGLMRHVQGTACQPVQLTERNGSYYRPNKLSPLSDEDLKKHKDSVDSYDQKEAQVQEIIYETVSKSVTIFFHCSTLVTIVLLRLSFSLWTFTCIALLLTHSLIRSLVVYT